jgi:hypothetical protein
VTVLRRKTEIARGALSPCIRSESGLVWEIQQLKAAVSIANRRASYGRPTRSLHRGIGERLDLEASGGGAKPNWHLTAE